VDNGNADYLDHLSTFNVGHYFSNEEAWVEVSLIIFGGNGILII
jgi:hypothetical protein